jgi:hypothetical protein
MSRRTWVSLRSLRREPVIIVMMHVSHPQTPSEVTWHGHKLLFESWR